MSEVKRWEPRNTALGYDMQPKPDGSFVLACDFDRVTAERDALQLRLNAADELNDSLRDRKNSIVVLQKRVDELEARGKLTNEELVVIARNAALNSVDRYNYMPCLPEEAYKWAPHYWVIEAMRAALNPTAEAAIPEHVCPGCNAQGWTANCDRCIPY